MTITIRPRKDPCTGCPYRLDSPSGLWSAAEYDLLPRFDGTTAEQAQAGAIGVFFCHAQPKPPVFLCSGWVGCHDMINNLGLRLYPHRHPEHQLDYDAIINYRTTVPLFGSGAEAAAHGKRDINNPGAAARRKAQQLIKIRGNQLKLD